MQSDKQFIAVQRGIKLAGFWKKTRRLISKWDRICVHWAKSRGLPGWLGHVPIVLAIMLSVVTALLGGLLIGLVIAFVWMAIVGLQSTEDDYVKDECLKNRSTSSEYRNGNQGYGLYSGPEDLVTSYRMDCDE
jgi:hypothetical protein